MTTFTIGLRPTATTAPAAAWFIPGDDVAAWVDELCRWGVPLGEVRVYVVPTGRHDRRPGGLLAVTPGRPRVERAVPYAATGRLFYPADAVLDPPVSADDLATLRHEVQVFHTAAGLVGFDAADVLTVADLIAPPPRRPADWSRADAGSPPLPALVSVEAEPVTVSAADLLAGGADGIGEAADESLAPDPPATLAGKLKGLFSRGGRPADLAAKRQQELERLVELIKTDPDAGLRHALPLRDLAGRGVAPPSATLGSRPVDFNLAKLGAGVGRADGWSIDHDLRRRLTAEYREAANRELALGRYRRAAYIFSHLLGDFAAAAAALAQGRYYREAAAVYRDHVKNVRAAADCLAGGGLLAEAIPLYRELSQYELAGDLHARLGQPADAAVCYRDAVAQHLHRRDVVAAAKLLAGKLGEPDQGLAVLAGAWPESDNAAVCLREWFSLAERHGRHDVAARRAGELRDADVPWYRAVALAETLSAVAVTYSLGQVRERAADAVRAVAGRRLADAEPGERAELVRAVVSLVPGDKLLARDGARFTTPTTRPPVPLKRAAPLVRSFRLPAAYQWRSVVAIDGGLLAVGTVGNGFAVARARWDGRVQTEVVPCDGASDARYVLLPPDRRGRAVTIPIGGRTGMKLAVDLPSHDAFADALTVGTPAYATSDALGACRHESGTTLLLHVDHDSGDLTLSHHDVNGELLLTRDVGGDGWEVLPAWPLAMAARRDEVYLAGIGHLLRIANRETKSIDLGTAVLRSITPNLPHTAVRMAVGLDEGWALVRGDEVQRFGQQLVKPLVTFTPDGSIVAAGQGVAHEYRATSTGLRFGQSFDVAVQSPLAVLPAGSGQVGCVDADGSVHVYRYAQR